MDRRVVFTPIGVIHTPFRERVDAPRQPRAGTDAKGTIELFPGRGFEDALLDLDRWQYAWLIFVFHANTELGFRPKVLPPRSDVKRGVFATRSPHRPNPIGLSVVRVEGVEGLTVRVAELDILDGTPLLDIKPYVAWADAIPDAGSGWLPEEDATDPRPRPNDPQAPWRVTFGEGAEAQLSFLSARGIELGDRIAVALAPGPRPHAYRRIRALPDGRQRLAVGEWRAFFRVRDREIVVEALATGHRPRDLYQARRTDPALDPHRAFVDAYGWSDR